MKLAGMLLMVSGWIIVISAVVLLSLPLSRSVFTFAGICLEFFGLFLAFRKEAL